MESFRVEEALGPGWLISDGSGRETWIVMRVWPYTAARGIVKEEFAERPDKAFGSRNLGYSGLGDLKARATRDKQEHRVWKRAGVREKTGLGWSHFACLLTQCCQQLAS